MDSGQNMDVDKNDFFNKNFFPGPDVNARSSPTHISSFCENCDTGEDCEVPHHIRIVDVRSLSASSAQWSQKLMNSVAVQCDLGRIVSTNIQCEPVLQVTQSVQCEPVLVTSRGIQCERSLFGTQEVQCDQILQISQANEYEDPCILSFKEQNLSEDCINLVSYSQMSVISSTSDSTTPERNTARTFQGKPSQGWHSTKFSSGDGESYFSTSGHVGDLEKETKIVERKRTYCTIGKENEVNLSSSKKSKVSSIDPFEKNNISESSHKNTDKETENSKDDNERILSLAGGKNDGLALSSSKHKVKRDEDYTAEELLNEMGYSSEFSLNNQGCRNRDKGDSPRSKSEETTKNNDLAEQKMDESAFPLDDTWRISEVMESSENEPSQLNTIQWFNSLACERASSPESINEDTVEELTKSMSNCHRQLHSKVMKKNTKCLDDDRNDTNNPNRAGPSWHRRTYLMKAKYKHLQEKPEEADQEPCRRGSSKLNKSPENKLNQSKITQWFNTVACERASSLESINEDTVESRPYCSAQLQSNVMMGLEDDTIHVKRSDSSWLRKAAASNPSNKLIDQSIQEEPLETDQEPCVRRSSESNTSCENEQAQFSATQLFNGLACEQASSPKSINESSMEELKGTKNMKGLHDNTIYRNRAGSLWRQRNPSTLKSSKEQCFQENSKETVQKPCEKRKRKESKSTPQYKQIVADSESDSNIDNSYRSDLLNLRNEDCGNTGTCTVMKEQSTSTPVRKSCAQGVRNTKVRLSPKRKPESELTRVKHVRDLRFFDDSDSDLNSCNASTVTYKTTTNIRSQPRRSYMERERKAILYYIIEHRYYSLVKGRSCWEQMEKANVCPGRTWQSLKEHFRKQILPNLEDYNLESSVVRKFKSVWTEYTKDKMRL